MEPSFANLQPHFVWQGADADRYQEKGVRNALIEIKQLEEEDEGEQE